MKYKQFILYDVNTDTTPGRDGLNESVERLVSDGWRMVGCLSESDTKYGVLFFEKYQYEYKTLVMDLEADVKAGLATDRTSPNQRIDELLETEEADGWVEVRRTQQRRWSQWHIRLRR